MLTKQEIEQLAFEIARDKPGADKNEAYHAHVWPWGKARGGVELGAWPAWNRGWRRGVEAHDKHN